MHGSLPTNSFRVSHHLTSNTYCHRCGAAVESDLHTLRGCPRAMSIWKDICPTSPNNFYMQDCQLWFKHHATMEASTKFIVTCFEIWRNRNEHIFQNVHKDTWNSVNSIISYHASMVYALGTTSKHHMVLEQRVFRKITS